MLALAGDLAEGEAATELCDVARDVPTVRQRGDTLGERIAAAHHDAAALFPGLAILQIGMDTPQVTATLLEDCRDRLTAPGIDAALGFAEDGGWWLLGLSDPQAAASIETVATSRSDTGARTLEALRHHGLRVHLVPRLSDVDTFEDAGRVAAAIPGSRFATAVKEAR